MGHLGGKGVSLGLIKGCLFGLSVGFGGKRLCGVCRSTQLLSTSRKELMECCTAVGLARVVDRWLSAHRWLTALIQRLGQRNPERVAQASSGGTAEGMGVTAVSWAQHGTSLLEKQPPLCVLSPQLCHRPVSLFRCVTEHMEIVFAVSLVHHCTGNICVGKSSPGGSAQLPINARTAAGPQVSGGLPGTFRPATTSVPVPWLSSYRARYTGWQELYG